MAGATIGALRFDLGADTAKLEIAMKQAKSQLRSLVAEGVAVGNLLSEALRAGFEKIGEAFRGILENADEMSKAAQQIGIPIEALSRLRYAADLSDVSFENLKGSLARFSRAMADAASDAQGTAGRAFAAIGVSVKDAGGHIRDTEAVIGDIAQKFAGMQDGAGKTALAIQLFGRQGAALIPLLNGGQQGLSDLGKEADRLGLTLSSQTGKAAEEFNDTLTRVGRVFMGLGNTLLAALLPTLQNLADRLYSAVQNSTLLRAAVDVLVVGFKALASIVIAVAGTLESAARSAAAVWELLRGIASGDFSGAWQKLKEGMEGANKAMKEGLQGAADIWGDLQAKTDAASVNIPLKMAPIVQSTRDLADQMRKLKDAQVAAMDAIVNAPTETYVNKINAINKALAQGAINQTKYGETVKKVEDENRNNITSTASLVASTLTTVFQNNKAASIAAAIINTAVGITNALAKLPPPFSWVQAALIAASGAAQIATIRSTNPDSGGGGAPSVSGGAAGGGAETAPAALPPSSSLTIDLPAGRYTADEVMQIISGINDRVQNGATLISTRIR